MEFELLGGLALDSMGSQEILAVGMKSTLKHSQEKSIKDIEWGSQKLIAWFLRVGQAI